jgi:hypothetical protein
MVEPKGVRGELSQEVTEAAKEKLGCVGENAALDPAYHPDSTKWREFVQALVDIKAVSDSYHLPAPVFAPLLCGDGDFNAPNENLR